MSSEEDELPEEVIVAVTMRGNEEHIATVEEDVVVGEELIDFFEFCEKEMSRDELMQEDVSYAHARVLERVHVNLEDTIEHWWRW